jgi:hypothetical protein
MVRRRSSSFVLLALVATMLLAGSVEASGAVAPARPVPAGTEAPGSEPTAAMAKPCGPREAWVGSSTDGIACLDARGWTLYDETKPFPGHGWISDIAVCRNGMTWIATASGLVSTNGRTWTDHSKTTKYKGFDAVACDSKGRAWLAGYDTVASFDGKKMTTYPVSKLGTGEFVKLLKDVAVAPDGHVWVATANSVATYDGTRWTFFEQGRGFDKNYYLEAIAVDTHGRVWVATSSDGLLVYDGAVWTTEAPEDFWMVRALAIDGADRVWAGTFSDGVAVFDGQAWVTYDRANSGLPSDGIKSIAVDSIGRAWIGTEWGLAVLAGTEWQAYHMSDSDIPDDEVTSLAVLKNGPALPARRTKSPGALAGRVVKSGDAQAGLAVEICVEDLGMMYSGPTPCTGQPFLRDTRTGVDGRFRFADLPVGKYVITVQDANGKWLTLSSQFGIGSRRQEVRSGKTTNLGDIDLARAK